MGAIRWYHKLWDRLRGRKYIYGRISEVAIFEQKISKGGKPTTSLKGSDVSLADAYRRTN